MSSRKALSSQWTVLPAPSRRVLAGYVIGRGARPGCCSPPRACAPRPAISARTSRRRRPTMGSSRFLPSPMCLLFGVPPHATATSLSVPQRLVSVAYSTGDLLIVATLARLLTPGTARGTAVLLLIVGTIGALASDVGYEVITYSSLYHRSTVLDVGWLVAVIAWGAARRGRGSRRGRVRGTLPAHALPAAGHGLVASARPDQRAHPPAGRRVPRRRRLGRRGRGRDPARGHRARRARLRFSRGCGRDATTRSPRG